MKPRATPDMLELGVCYYPEQWDKSLWREDARRMVELGLDWVRIAEFSWARVEPEQGRFDWGWLDEVIAILGEAGLKVVLCTPTAAPPKWLVDAHPDILPVDQNGHVRNFGSRRHYCFSSWTYQQEACRIAQAFGERYGQNRHVKAWQIDNEYGDHDTVQSYSDGARAAFRLWLAEKYGPIEGLNWVWGTAFWGAQYNSFDAVELPNKLVDEPNPAHAMDFARFCSHQVFRFNKAQADILHKLSPGRPVTHNFMANSFDFDHYALSDDLDFAAWDSYPLGALVNGPLSAGEKARWLRTGSPDYQAFYSDLYRHVGKGKVWITEQQPGPVNWADYNPAPADGMIRLWTWMAYAHGVDVVCYFRWRQAPFGQEQFHSALLLADNTPDQAYHEVAQIARERSALVRGQKRGRAQVALVLDYPSRWAEQIQPQGKAPLSPGIAFDWYQVLSGLGVDVDVIGPDADLSGYTLVLLPDMMVEHSGLIQALRCSDAKVVLGPRCGSKTVSMSTPETLAPGAFSALIDLRVLRVESLPPDHGEPVMFEGVSYDTSGWRASIETSAKVIGEFTGAYRTGWPAIVQNARCRYLAVAPDADFLRAFLTSCLRWSDVESITPKADVRTTQRGNLVFSFNFGAVEAGIAPAEGGRFLIGQPRLAAYDLAVEEVL